MSLGLEDTTARVLAVLAPESPIDLAEHAGLIASVAHRSRRHLIQADDQFQCSLFPPAKREGGVNA